MATKTYLQLVNSVLTRLREDTVSSVSSSAYSLLIGQYVNDAKRLVEDSFNWQALRTSVNVSIVASTTTYTISTLNERSRLVFKATPESNTPMAYDVTSGDKFQLIYRPWGWVVDQRELQNTADNQPKPIIFGLTKNPTDGVKVELMETPTGSRTWKMYFTNPQDDLSSDSDVLLVPSPPVIQIALDYALNERGEEVGEPGTTVEQRAQMHISNAIALDAIEQDDLTTWAPN